MTKEKKMSRSETSDIAWAIFILGVAFVVMGIFMIYQERTITIGPTSLSAGLVLLIFGFVLTVVALGKFPKTEDGQPPSESWFSKNWLILLTILIAIVLLGTFIGTHYKFPLEDKSLLSG